MEIADYWLLEKQLVHKLFKVLVPRFQDYSVAYTRMYKAPKKYPDDGYAKALLELRGNPYPPLKKDNSYNRKLIHNILLEEAKREYRVKKYAEIAGKIAEDTENLLSNKQEVETLNLKQAENMKDVTDKNESS